MAKNDHLDVKICGLKTPEAMEAALAGGANHVGFIFFEKSPRHIEIGNAAGLRVLVGARAKTVAVSVDADDAMLDEIVKNVLPDLLQLHGRETPDRVRAIRARYGLPVIKAFAIRDVDDLAQTAEYADCVEKFLFDAKPPKGSDLPGGNGVSFDWSLLREFDAKKPVMLSGGLDRTNIAEAVMTARPAGIDISSGVETGPGVKDISLIAGFLEEVGKLQSIMRADGHE